MSQLIKKVKKMFATGKKVLLLILTGLLLTACGGQGGGGGGGSVNIDNGGPAQPEKEAPRVIIID
ncbi:MAG: hypothetical protein D3914_00110 [Candidatus Electrothrix sp. LOE2]|nr:hypothetical protein [Candidatus Electrothrix sp. LOE2]